MGIASKLVQATLWGPPEPVNASQLSRSTIPIPESLPAEAQLPVDPRPDLTEDSDLWVRLLAFAEGEDPMLAGTLHGFRCAGTRIRQGQKGYVLRPDVDPTGNLAWGSQTAYEEDREKWLRPHAGKIAELLRRL